MLQLKEAGLQMLEGNQKTKGFENAIEGKGLVSRVCEPNSKHRWELTSLNEVKNSPGRGEVTGLPMAPVDGLCLQNGAYLLNATKKVVKMRL